MSIEVTCGKCGKLLKAKDSAAGAVAKCPQCGDPIRIPKPEDLPPADQMGFDVSSLANEVSRLPTAAPRVIESAPEEDRKPCPKCGEMIPAGAAKCRFCNHVLNAKVVKAAKKAKSASGGDDDDLSTLEIVVAVICSGIGCIISIIWLVQGKPKWKKMIAISLIMQAVWVTLRLLLMAANK